jgi:DnaD/phage-associated family protein
LHFIKQTADFDLGDTPIENIFINDFMPMANGTYVKVYLLGYKYANDKDPSLSINHRTIAKHLTIPLSDVLDAWDFWEQKGIIKKIPSDTEDSTEYSVEFLNLKQLYVYNNFKVVNAAKKDEEPSQPYYCSPSDLVEANKVPEFKEMFRYIDQIYRRPLHPNEKKKVLDWVYNYNMDTDLIVRAFMYCVEQRNAKSLKYIGAVITSWYDNGITNMDQLDKHLEKTDTRYSQYRKIYKFLGMNTNDIPEPTKKVMHKWLVQWNFSIDIILKACEHAVKRNKIDFNYINAILENWKENNIQSIKDIENNKTPKKTTQEKPKKAPTNRFHNFEQRTSKYSKDELEKLLRKKE